MTTKLIHGTCMNEMREDGVGAFPYDCDAARTHKDSMVYSCGACHCWTYVKNERCDVCRERVTDGQILVTMLQRHMTCAEAEYGDILDKRRALTA